MKFEAKVLCGARMPVGLLDLAAPPKTLSIVGGVPAGPRVAVVGTRHPTRDARDFVEEFACQLSRAGVVVVSGGAIGIDTGAHEGALRGGTPSLVVAPCGWDRPFPSENAGLFRRIVAGGGGYLSEQEPEIPAALGAFFRRNAIMVALSLAVVVVEAGFRSGSRNAAKWGRRMGRGLFAVPHSPWDTSGGGCNLELRLGAQVCLSARDILKFLKRTGVTPLAAAPTLAGSQPAQAGSELGEAAPSDAEDSCSERLLHVLARGPRHIEELCQLLGGAPGALQQTLTELELEGVLLSDAPGWFHLR